MRKLVFLPLFVALVVPAVAGGSTATTSATQWSAKLSPSEVKPKQAVKNTSANGSFSGKAVGLRLQFKLTFSKLSGPATGAHIGYGKKGKPGNISMALCAPCPNPTVNTAGLNPALVKAFNDHLLYIEVDTQKNPNGEIRGQLG